MRAEERGCGSFRSVRQRTALGTALSIDERRTKKAKATAAQLPPKVAADRDSEFSHTPSGELVTNKDEALKRFLRRKQVTAASDSRPLR
jgi:hypothetical protein